MSEALNQQDAISLALHLAVKACLLENPEAVIKQAKDNMKCWRLNYDESPIWMEQWAGILDQGVESIVPVLEGLDELSILLRSSSPFAGVIDPDRRLDIIQKTINKRNQI